MIVSGAGLSDSVMAEIERCLKAHELIKIRVFSDDRLQREELLAQICERTGASPVQHIGKILVVYREKPEPPTPKRAPAARLKAKAKAPPRRKPGTAPRSKAPHAGARQWSPRAPRLAPPALASQNPAAADPARAAPYSYRTSSISYCLTPPGVTTSTASPAYLPISARAMGELIEILAFLMSASSSPTIW